MIDTQTRIRGLGRAVMKRAVVTKAPNEQGSQGGETQEKEVSCYTTWLSFTTSLSKSYISYFSSAPYSQASRNYTALLRLHDVDADIMIGRIFHAVFNWFL